MPRGSAMNRACRVRTSPAPRVAPSVVPMSFSKKATGRFQVGSWTENVYADIDEGEGMTAGEAYYPKRGLTHAQVEYTYSGDIEGTSVVGYLIAYKPDAAPVFAFERFTGSIGGQEG